jgi:hypothetical protein
MICDSLVLNCHVHFNAVYLKIIKIQISDELEREKAEHWRKINQEGEKEGE